MDEINKKIGKRIKALRDENGLSQHDFGGALGFSRPTVSQIENGERKITAEELLKISSYFNVSVDNLLGREKGPEVILPIEKTKAKKPQMRINIPQKNMSKFKEVFLYILNKVGAKENIGETVIYKLLYFIDFDFYEKYEEQIIGATYIKNNFGPTPNEFQKLVERMIEEGEIERIESKYYTHPQKKYLPHRAPDLSQLGANEVKIIDDVLNRLSDMNANQISEYSHRDVPWLAAEEGGVIEYESVFYRTMPYTVRGNGDDEVQ